MSEARRGFPVRHVLAGLVVVALSAATAVVLSIPEGGRAPGGEVAAEGPLGRLNPQLVTKTKAPDFELPDREGTAHRLSTHLGRPVVLNFWSVDCPPCVEELPSLTHLAKRGEASGEFSVITVSVDPGWEKVRSIFPEGITPPLILFDPEREVVEGRYGTKLFPETFLIDAEGQVRARFDGARNWMSPDVFEVLEGLRRE